MDFKWKNWWHGKGDHHNKGHHAFKNDESFKITKRCFKMTEAFGGEAEQYRDFVTNNK